MDRKLKIGIISDTFLPLIGGAEIHVKNLAYFLKRAGCEIEIFTNTAGEDAFDGIRVIRNFRKGFRPTRFFRDLISLSKFIKNKDIIHGHYTFYLSFISSVIARIFKKTFVVTLHGLGTLDSSVNKFFRRRIYRWVSFKLADAVIATSDEMVSVAKRFVGDEKIFLITNGVDTEEFKPAAKGQMMSKEKLIVLSMRRLNPKNGVQYLIESIPYIVEKIQNIEFWISGKERLEDYLKNRVNDLGIEKFVKFIGDVPNDQTKNYYEKADIVTFPSSAESTSIACLEAMSMGKCVVASALEVFKMMLGDNERGLLVRLFDRESSDYDAPLNLPKEKIKMLADAIVTLFKNDALRQEIGRNARAYVVDNYDWRVLVKSLLKIYRGLLK